MQVWASPPSGFLHFYFLFTNEISFLYWCICAHLCLQKLLLFALPSRSALSLCVLVSLSSLLGLSSSPVPDQTQVLRVHPAAVSGGGAGPLPGSSAAAGIPSPPPGPLPHRPGPPWGQVGFLEFPFKITKITEFISKLNKIIHFHVL